MVGDEFQSNFERLRFQDAVDLGKNNRKLVVLVVNIPLVEFAEKAGVWFPSLPWMR